MRGLSANSLACHCEEQSDEAISRPRLPRSLRSLAMTRAALAMTQVAAHIVSLQGVRPRSNPEVRDCRAALAMTTRQWIEWRKDGGEDLGPLAGGEDEKGQSLQPKPMGETGGRT